MCVFACVCVFCMRVYVEFFVRVCVCALACVSVLCLECAGTPVCPCVRACVCVIGQLHGKCV